MLTRPKLFNFNCETRKVLQNRKISSGEEFTIEKLKMELICSWRCPDNSSTDILFIMVALWFSFMVFTEEGPLHWNCRGARSSLWAGPVGTRLTLCYMFFIILMDLMQASKNDIFGEFMIAGFVLIRLRASENLNFFMMLRRNDVNYSLKGEDNWFLFIQSSTTFSRSAESGLCVGPVWSVFLSGNVCKQTTQLSPDFDLNVASLWLVPGSCMRHQFSFFFFFPTEDY